MVLMQAKHLLLLLQIKILETDRKLYCEAATGSAEKNFHQGWETTISLVQKAKK